MDARNVPQNTIAVQTVGLLDACSLQSNSLSVWGLLDVPQISHCDIAVSSLEAGLAKTMAIMATKLAPAKNMKAVW
jgi:hypothetical protein